MRLYNKIVFFVFLIFLASCKPNINSYTPNAGTTDFSSYVAVGNSLTAGYASGALFISGQKYGWANILAQQMKKVGMKGEFKIPYMPTEDGVGASEGSSTPVFRTKYVLGYSKDCLGNTSLGPVPSNPQATQAELYKEITTSVAAGGPYNNLGIPGIKVTDLLSSGLALRNPYFYRIATNPSDTLLYYAAKVHPTFFSLWIGNNDVLGYATSGGVGDFITPMNGAIGVGFKASMEAAVKYLVSITKGGVLADIPDITSIPYLNTIPYNAISLTKQTEVDQLNAAYAPYNAAMTQMGLPYRIKFHIGANAMVISDPAMPLPASLSYLKIRQIKSDEFVMLDLPTDSLKCAYWGTQKPVPAQYVLTEAETQKVEQAITSYNAEIKSLAKQYNLAFVDFNSIMKGIEHNGLTVDGIHFTTKFITGNLFSLDGVHLTPQGNAVVANYFIDAINTQYGSHIPKVMVSDYPPIVFP